MFQSLWSRLVGDAGQRRVIVTKRRHECPFVDGVGQIPKGMGLRVVSIKISEFNIYRHVKMKCKFTRCKLFIMSGTRLVDFKKCKPVLVNQLFWDVPWE